MNEIEIKRHNFNLAKERLKEFSEKEEGDLQIEKVQTEGFFFGLGDHKVTGNELNNRLESIQKNFIVLNTSSNKIIKEFREIYNALDALDKDYITSIVSNLKAIEKTSNDVRVQQGTLKQHQDTLVEQQSKLDVHQVEIEKSVENISKIVTILKDFKEKLEGYTHLQDIDNIWDYLNIIKTSIDKVSEDIQIHQKELDILTTTGDENKQSINALYKSVADAEVYAITSRNLIVKLEAFREKISALNHLMKVDEIWEQVKDYQLRIKNVEKNCGVHTNKLNELMLVDDKMRKDIDSNTHDISSLKEYKNKLDGLYHLSDIDSIWKDVEEHTFQLIEDKKRSKELLTIISKNKDEVDKNIADAIQNSNIAVESLAKRIKYVSWIAGGAVGLAIFELILLFVNML